MVPIEHFFKNTMDFFFFIMMVFAEHIFFSAPSDRNNNGLIYNLLEHEGSIKRQWLGFTELSLPIPLNGYVHLYGMGWVHI